MILIPVTIRPNQQYFQLIQSKVPAELSGSLASLPLIFSFDHTNSILSNSNFLKYFKEVLKPSDFVTAESKAPGLQVVYPVINSDSKIYYIPQVLPNGINISMSSEHYSDPSFPSISIRTSSGYLSINSFVDFKVYNQLPDTYHDIPEIITHKFDTHLRTQIFTRYFRPSTIESNPVLDSFLPFLACSYVPNYSGSTTYAISPLTADLTGAKQIPLTTILTTILKQDLSTLHTTLLAIKRAKLTVIFTGTGGTGINTICWLSSICDHFGITDLFHTIHVYESDYVDFSNIFRFPLPLSTYTNKSDAKLPKVDLIKSKITTLSSVVFYHNKFLTQLSDIPATLLDGETLKPSCVIYGAPSIYNRNFLSSLGAFVSATHANNTASLYINPISDDILQVETYGLIQLNSFFINQISMALGFLDILASGSYTMPHHHFADYTFEASTIGPYNFDIKSEMTAIPIDGDL